MVLRSCLSGTCRSNVRWSAGCGWATWSQGLRTNVSLNAHMSIQELQKKSPQPQSTYAGALAPYYLPDPPYKIIRIRRYPSLKVPTLTPYAIQDTRPPDASMRAFWYSLEFPLEGRSASVPGDSSSSRRGRARSCQPRHQRDSSRHGWHGVCSPNSH
jgi:hypothetical protein